MISSLLAIILLSASIKGTMELRKRFGKHFGQCRPKLLRPKKQGSEKRYSFWDSYLERENASLKS